MTEPEEPLDYRRLRAPQDDGDVFLEPDASQIPSVLSANRRLCQPGAAYSQVDCRGRTLLDLARDARRELLQRATRYTSQYRDVQLRGHFDDVADGPLVLAGHQPSLFHPGVWSKNAVIDRIAAVHGGVAINLLIDSDTVRTGTLRVPTGNNQRPSVESIPFCDARPEVAYEECGVEDWSTLERCGPHATETLRSLVKHPLLETFWPSVVAHARASGNLGQGFARARHELEGRWSLATLEVPQSEIAQMTSFHWMTAWLLADLPRLRDIYNSSVAEFRRANRIRSVAHPVPDLAADGPWLEAPFWIWSQQDPRRRRLFVQCQPDHLRLTDRDAFHTKLELSRDGDAETAAQQLVDLADRGVKIRSRALMTTMFARLLLGDLFVHGIGGAKYDQVTDQIMLRILGFSPPGFVATSATLRLPIAKCNVSREDLREVQQQLRELDFHPEKFLELGVDGATDPEARRWLDNKRTWIAAEQTPENARKRHLEITGSNEHLQKFIVTARQAVGDSLDQMREKLRNNAILSSREYAFCLHPEANLRNFLLDNVSKRI